MPGYSCLRQVSMDTSKDLDLDVLQAAINLSHRDTFLRDRASRRVTMKRLYQRHPVTNMCQEGVSKCSNVMGATFILILILYRIYSKQSRAEAARIKIRYRAAVVHAVKSKAECATASQGCAVAPLYHKAACGSTAMIGTGLVKVKGHAYLLMVVRQLLLMSGDVELNPGPWDQEMEEILLTVDDTTFDENSWNDVIIECHGHSLAAKWQVLSGYLGLPVGTIDIIKENHPKDSVSCWNEALLQWIRQNYTTSKFGLPSWRTLLRAIGRVHKFQFQKLADQHKMMHRTLGSSQRVVKKRRRHRQKRKMNRMDAILEKDDGGPEKISMNMKGDKQMEWKVATGAEGLSKPRLTFPILDQKKMTKKDKEHLEQRLYSESSSIMFKFQRLFSATVKSLKERNITVKELSNHIGCLEALKPAYTHSSRGCLGSELPKAKTIDDVITLVREYSSFFNYDMIENIIENLGGEQDRTNLAKYLEDFAEYAKRIVFECPRELGTMNVDGCANIFVTLDRSYNHCTVSSLDHFKHVLQAILNIPPDVAMTLYRLEPGSLKLTFQIPLLVQQNTFPLSDGQKVTLIKWGVTLLSCGSFLFTNQEAGSKENSSSEEEEDSEGDSDALSMIASSGMSVVGQKGNGGASNKDSGFGTWTRPSVGPGSTVAGESQISEDIVKLEVGFRDAPYLRMTHNTGAKLQPIGDASGLELHLHQVSYRGELDRVVQLVETQRVNPLLKDMDGNATLHHAAMGGDLNVMKYFIEEQGLSPACQGRYGRTALHHVAEHKHLELVKYLVREQHMDPLCKDEDWGYTSLHTACLGGDMEVIQFLINEMLKYMSLEDVINERGKNGDTPFHIAAFYGHFPVVKFFITKLNFDPNTPGFKGRPALHAAAQQGHLEVVRYLIEEAKCDPSCCPGENKATPLHIAAAYGRLDVVRYLTKKHHCNPLSRNSHGNTPLHNAALHGHFKVVEFFISELNCDPNTPGQRGTSPLHHACQGGSMDIVKYLIEQMNCNASQLDERQVTPLHMAAMSGHLHIVKYLIQDKLCNPLCRASDRNTPLYLAARDGHLEVVQYYIQTIQCSPNIRGWNNMTPLERARSNGHTHVVNYLESLSTL